MSLINKIALAIVVVLLIGVGAVYAIFRPTASVDTANPAKIIEADFVDLSKVFSISKYRSGSGHDFSGNGEKCRSMKHYFNPQASSQGVDIQQFIGKVPNPATGTAIYSPAAGKITSVTEEQTPVGKQVTIRPEAAPSYAIRLFHVYLLDSVQKGSAVTAGQLIGYLHPGQATDIAIQVATIKGTQYISYFDAMPDSLFATYKARGVTSRDQLIISMAGRDAKPLKCNGEQFATQTGQNGQDPDNEVYLTGYQTYEMTDQN